MQASNVSIAYLAPAGLVEDIDQFQGIGWKVKGETGLECVL